MHKNAPDVPLQRTGILVALVAKRARTLVAALLVDEHHQLAELEIVPVIVTEIVRQHAAAAVVDDVGWCWVRRRQRQHRRRSGRRRSVCKNVDATAAVVCRRVNHLDNVLFVNETTPARLLLFCIVVA